ncbi:MAG: GNAT family N-acetyltransferase [Patescibacteria group bacterium]|nr:GNAT family N-acetyltransferase [Patescibacteria group bacterium]
MIKPKITFKKALPKDWEIIQKLNHQIFQDNSQYDKYEDVNWPFSKNGINYFKKVTSNKNYYCLIIYDDDKPIGYLAGVEKKFGYRTNKTAEIENMGISPQYRSQGLGTKLINKFRQWCKQKNFTHIYVNSYYKNKKAINFYKNQGLKPIDISLEGKVSTFKD